MDKWELPPSLRVTDPEVLEKAEQMRAELAARANSPFASFSPAEQRRARAFQISEEIEADIERINEQLEAMDIQVGDEFHALLEARVALSSQLAEEYAIIGRFDLAAEIEPRQEHREHYQEVIKAINRDDSVICKCPPGRTYVSADVFSMRHNRVLPLVKCSACGFMNVKALPKDLAAQRKHRAAAKQLVEGMTPDAASATLRTRGHTTDGLLKE